MNKDEFLKYAFAVIIGIMAVVFFVLAVIL